MVLPRTSCVRCYPSNFFQASPYRKWHDPREPDACLPQAPRMMMVTGLRKKRGRRSDGPAPCSSSTRRRTLRPPTAWAHCRSPRSRSSGAARSKLLPGLSRPLWRLPRSRGRRWCPPIAEPRSGALPVSLQFPFVRGPDHSDLIARETCSGDEAMGHGQHGRRSRTERAGH